MGNSPEKMRRTVQKLKREIELTIKQYEREVENISAREVQAQRRMKAAKDDATMRQYAKDVFYARKEKVPLHNIANAYRCKPWRTSESCGRWWRRPKRPPPPWWSCRSSSA